MPETYDILCLSHLRWDFVYQRPQHLLSRFARRQRVFFFEEPVWDAPEPALDLTRRADGVWVAVPHLPEGLAADASEQAQRDLLAGLLHDQNIERYALWVYTPMALGFAQDLKPLVTVYDCMDELSAFAGASQLMRDREVQLFQMADFVFTGGQSLYEAKRGCHPRVYAFPSSVDVTHFAQALSSGEDPEDQKDIPHPRLGFFGVIDERMDLDLLAGVADLRPDWHLVIIGPTVKIDPATLPRRGNIHYLGGKAYGDLPSYLAGWDVALLPFARNESTRFISPTKTPEYLAAGQPVVSTSVRDVVRPYGELGLVRIADTPDDFVAAAEAALREDAGARRRQADAFLAQMSWDKTWGRMAELLDAAVFGEFPPPAKAPLQKLENPPTITV